MFRRLHRSVAAAAEGERDRPMRAHVVTSEFDASICRFVLSCSCGVTHDTNYIDEALEWHEMHRALAPLSDQLVDTRN